MLKVLRNKKIQKQIYIVLAITVVIGFVISGVIVGTDDAKTPSTLGRIGNRSVLLKDYLASYRAVNREAMFVYGEKLNEARKFLNLKGEAWDRILLLDHAKKEGIKVADQDVVQWLMTQEAFVYQGKFNHKVYESFVRESLRISPRDFEEEIRQRLTISEIVEKIRSSVLLSEEELKEAYQRKKGKKSILYAVIPWENEKDKIAVTDEEITQLLSITKDKLSDPERRRIQYLFIPNEDAAKTKAALDERLLSLDEIAKQHSLPLQTTDLFTKNDAIPGIGLSPEILDKSFSLAVNEESEWLMLSKGHYKIKVLEMEPERPLSQEEANKTVKELMVKQKATELAISRLKAIEDKIKSDDFEKTLAAEGLSVQRFEDFSAEAYVPGIGRVDGFYPAIEPLKENEVSQILQVPTGAAVIKVLGTSTPGDSNYEAEKVTFKTQMIEEKTGQKMQDLIMKLRNKLTLNMEAMRQIFPEDDQPKP